MARDRGTIIFKCLVKYILVRINIKSDTERVYNRFIFGKRFSIEEIRVRNDTEKTIFFSK